MENTQKVAIIGGGICGLYLGWKLSEKGHEVTIFEKKNRIGSEVCSGLFSQRILEFIPQSEKLIQNKIKFVILNFPKKIIKVAFSKKNFVISHFELDRLIASLAERAGAKIVLNYNISSMPEGFDKIIGCDGAFSFVRRNLKLPDPKFRLAMQGFVKEESRLDYVEVWPCDNGFIWKIPRGSEIEYGIISNVKKTKVIFNKFLKENNLFLERINPVEEFRQKFSFRKFNSQSESKFLYGVKAKIVPQGFIIPFHPSITLCGDAAGLTKPWSGGGVIWGLTAAEILLNNFSDFRFYKKKIKKFFIPKIVFSKITTKLVYFLGFKTPWLLPNNTKIESDFLL